MVLGYRLRPRCRPLLRVLGLRHDGARPHRSGGGHRGHERDQHGHLEIAVHAAVPRNERGGSRARTHCLVPDGGGRCGGDAGRRRGLRRRDVRRDHDLQRAAQQCARGRQSRERRGRGDLVSLSEGLDVLESRPHGRVHRRARALHHGDRGEVGRSGRRRPIMDAQAPLRAVGSCSTREARAAAFDDDRRPRRRFLDRPGLVLQVHGRGGQGRGNGVLVDDLLLAIVFEQHAEGVVIDDRALQPDSVGQKDSDDRLLPLQVFEERVLQPVNVVLCHP